MNKFYRPEVDSLRAIAVIIVIFFHSGLNIFSGGYIGVDVFLVISGYLISSLIISEVSNDTFTFISFFERRLRRLIPALFFIIIISLIFSWYLLTPSELKKFGQSIIASSFFTSNILFWRESGYFETEAELKPLLHTWSLSLEVQFYIFFSFFLFLIIKLKRKWVIAITILIFLLSLLISIWGSINKPIANFYLLPSRGWEFLIGFFLAYLNIFDQNYLSRIKNEMLCLVGLCMIIFTSFFYNGYTPYPSLYSLLPTIGTALLIICMKPNTFIFKVFNLKVFVLLGLISYSAYLWHFPMIVFTKILFGDHLNLSTILIIIFSTIVLSYISWIYIEKPFRDKKILNSCQVIRILLASLTILLCIGSYFTFSNGGLHFYEKKDRKILTNFIDPSKYVTSRYNKLELRDFESSDNENILLIGDSFGEDLLNSFYESKSNKQFISTYYILSRCGVLMVKTKYISKFQAKDCKSQKTFFSSEKLIQLMQEANEIWITSNWEKWNIQFIQQSIENISRINPNIKIFGSKYFGSVSERDFISNRLNLSNNINNQKKYIDFNEKNNNLEQTVLKTSAEFINLQRLLCNNEINCNPIDKDNLVSYDGKHLTKFGAKKLGNILLKEGYFK